MRIVGGPSSENDRPFRRNPTADLFVIRFNRRGYHGAGRPAFWSPRLVHSIGPLSSPFSAFLSAPLSASAASTLSFKQAAVKSGLVSQQKIDRAAELIGTDDEIAIAKALVQSGIVTQYQSDQLASGRTKLNLGPYLITDWIGQGGMGQVFKAVHRVMGRVCAVKVLPLEKSTELSRDSFIREIRLQAELDHPCVVRAYDAGQDGSVHYLVTEFVPGTDLRRLVREHRRLSPSKAASIIAQVARGLHYAHEIGLVHRDIKPGNILVTPDGIAKLSDIGLATWTMGQGDDPRAGKIVGTADYLSPEQIQTPRSVGHLSDIYSLGCTLYFSVTGKVPFPGGDPRSKCKRHCEQTAWDPRKLAPDLPEDFVDTIADMMEKTPEKRIQSAAEVAARLQSWADEIDEIMPPISRDPWRAPPPPHQSPIHLLGDAPPFGAQPDVQAGIGTIDPDNADSVANVEHTNRHPSNLDSSVSPPMLDLEMPVLPRRTFIGRIEPLIWNVIVLAIGIAIGLLVRPLLPTP